MKNITDIPVQSLFLLFFMGGVLALSFYIIRNYVIPLLRNNKGIVKKYWQKTEIVVVGMVKQPVDPRVNLERKRRNRLFFWMVHHLRR